MLVDLKAPVWATHFLSDLNDWNKAPLPVAELAPFELPDDVYFEYAYQDQEGNRRPDPDNENPVLNPWWDFASNLQGPDWRPDPPPRVWQRLPDRRASRAHPPLRQ